MKIVIALFSAFLMMACSNNDTQKRTETVKTRPPEAPPALAPSAACFTQATDKDTVWLHLVTRDGEVSGDLQYNLFEKDKNSGTIKGVLKGDTLFADYTFSSEGTTSVRQVAFLKKGDGYTEGYGMPAEKNGKTVFKKGTLRFSDSLLLHRVDCN